jgi:uncharacterized membrane protein YphA (DoxX/SURF4 family)
MYMDDSMAHPFGASSSVEAPAWKTAISHLAAFAIAVLFLSAGIWKITAPFTWVTMVEQLKVPYQFSLFATLALGISEAFAGALVIVPRFRRWGAMLAAALLVIFMIYIGVNYSELIGKDCSCFPWMKRTIGPGFFVGDAVMLLLAIIAGIWSRKPDGIRTAAVILGAVAVFSGVFYGMSVARQTGAKAPESITVDGQPVSLQHGRIFLFFYDPQCSHCEAAAKKMSKMNWAGTKLISIPTAEPRYAASFLRDTGFKAGTSLDLDTLKKIFPFGDPPYGVVLENGREKGAVSRYDDTEPAVTLKKLGAIE